MGQKYKIGLGLALFVLLFAAAAFAYNTLKPAAGDNRFEFAQRQDNESNERQRAPDFSMTNWDGETVTLAEIIAGGKPIVLNFWASWCPPCRIEMPDFETVYRELGGEIQFLMLNMTDGQRETRARGEQYIRDAGFSFPVYFDTGRQAAYFYGIRSIPTTLFIDRDGYIITGATGAIDERMLRTGIDFIR